MTTLRNILENRHAAFGFALCYPCAGIVERVGQSWDWIWIDAQHGQFTLSDVLSCVRASEIVGSRAVVRPPGKSSEALATHADLCPAGIMVPMVNSADEARSIVGALRFPPAGERSYGSRRAGDLHARYHRELDLFIIAQIETAQAVADADAIAKIDGIDCLFFGANDVRLSMGIEQDVPLAEAPRLSDAMRRSAQAARAAGKIAGCVAVGEVAVHDAFSMGYQLIAASADQLCLQQGSAAALRAARSRLASPPPMQVARL